MKIVFLFLAFTLGIFAVFPHIAFSPTVLVQKKEIPEQSLQEDLGQMLIIGFAGQEVTPELKALMEKIRPGGVLLLGRNIANKEQTGKLVEDLQKLSLETTGLKLFIATDQEGGSISRIPFAERTEQSALKDYDQAFSIGKKRAEDLAEIGVNMNLAPVLDSGNPGDFLYPRTFQKNYTESLRIAEGLILGQQEGNIIVVPKHFPGYDGIAFNPEENAIPSALHIPSTLLFSTVFHRFPLPFVMVSHVLYKDMDSGNVFPFSEKGIQFAKQELGQNTLVMSDDILSPAFLKKFSYEEIGKNAIRARVNIMLAAGYPNEKVVPEFYQQIFKSVSSDAVLQVLVKNSATRIIALKKEILQ